MRSRFAALAVLCILVSTPNALVRGGPADQGLPEAASRLEVPLERDQGLVRTAARNRSAGKRKKLRYVDAAFSDFVSEKGTGRMFATVDSRSANHPNTIVEIAPKKARILRSIPVSPNPSMLTLAGDGRTAYIRIGAATVQRVDLVSETVVATFEPKIETEFNYPLLIAALAVVPTQPDALLVSFAYDGISGVVAGTAIYDNGVRRAAHLPSFAVTSLTFGSDPTLVYAFDSLMSTGGIFYRIRISLSGLAFDGPRYVTMGDYYTHVILHDGLFYTSQGRVIDAENRRFHGWMISGGSSGTNMAIDPTTNRIVFARKIGADLFLFVYDLATYRLVGTDVLQWSDLGVSRMAFFENGLLALHDYADGRIFFYPSKRIRPIPPPEAVPPTPENGSVRRIPIAHWDCTWDAATAKLYVGVPGDAGSQGNSIVTIDPRSGIVSDPAWIGSEPAVLRVSGDRLYVGLWGNMRLARMALPGMQALSSTDLVTDYRPFGFEPEVQNAIQIEPIPGSPRSVAVLHAREPWFPELPGASGVHVYDDGVKRVRFAPNSANNNHPTVSTFEVSSDGSRIFGLNWTAYFDFANLSLQTDGVAIDGWTPEVGVPYRARLHCVGDTCYTDLGHVIDVRTRSRIGKITLPEAAFSHMSLAVLPDPGRGVLYLFVGLGQQTQVYTYDIGTLQMTGAYRVPGESGPAWNPVFWADGQVAYSTVGAIVLVPLSALQPI